ncbi:MAG: aldo/keto reductase [Candidatus Heimdallarchaeota archaeon]|nr:aldo/keto reductase [Candidatus Heimdallarchaeota archaeon]
MDYTNLGKTGITVSKLCLGMMSYGNTQEWQLEIDEAKPIVEKAIDAGINFFDTANVYSRGRSEEITGQLLEDYRDDVVIATKVRFQMGDGPNQKGLNRLHMLQQIDASLSRMNLDYVDLYQIHRWDYSVDIEYIMRTLNHLIDIGATLHIGASSMYAWELAKAQYTAEKLGLEKFATMQNHYNTIYREEEREVIPFCIDQGMGIIPWSPLGRGFLTGKYQRSIEANSPRYRSDPYLKSRYFHDNDFDVLDAITEVSKEQEMSIAQIALSWILHQPGITSPIIGVTKMKHLEEAIQAVSIKLNIDQIRKINEAYSSRPVIGHSYDLSDNMISVKK